MAYATAAFGKADGSNVTGTVSQHYGAFKIGNAEGVIKTEGAENELTINFDGDKIDLPVVMPEGSVVTDIITNFATGSVTAATVGSVNIAAANGTKATWVAVPLGGKVTVTGPTAGEVIVKYLHVA